MHIDAEMLTSSHGKEYFLIVLTVGSVVVDLRNDLFHTAAWYQLAREEFHPTKSYGSLHDDPVNEMTSEECPGDVQEGLLAGLGLQILVRLLQRKFQEKCLQVKHLS
jgi:hypothetical protein